MRHDLLEHILNISRRMSETRTLKPLLNYVTGEAMNLVGAERGYLVLIKAGGTLDFQVKRDQNGAELADAEDQISSSVLNQVVESGLPIVLEDAMHDPQFSRAQSVMDLKLRSIMCVPLIVHGKKIGAIYVENRSITGLFSHNDAPPLILFANQAAVAIENARLNDELEARVAARTEALEQAMTQVEDSWAEAIEANRLRTVWLSNVAHDLGTPLSIVSGSLSLLQRGRLGSLNDQQLLWIDKSIKTINHMSNLIQNLFDLSKMETGGIKLNPELVELKDFLENVFDVGMGLPWASAVTFKLNLSSPIPNKVYMDPIRIRQVLLNLISNAQKFTDEGSVTCYARYLNEENKILMGVADSGLGIANDKLEQVFHRFQQVHDDSELHRQGTGLGLAICRELVEMHGGQIWVESQPGVGSDFYVYPAPVSNNIDHLIIIAFRSWLRSGLNGWLEHL